MGDTLIMSDAETEDLNQSLIDHTWVERGVRPAVLLHVVGVFLGFIVLAHFVFRSGDAVKALALAAFGSVVATVPGILKKSEYHLNPDGLSKRSLIKGEPQDSRELFRWEELSHLIPTKAGFKYYKKLDEPNRLLSFLKFHLLSDHAGEFHVGPEERSRVETIIDNHAIPRAKPSKAIKSGR